MPARSFPLRAIARFLMSLSSLCLVIALILFGYSKYFLSTAVKAQGEVTSLEQGGEMYFPVFVFTDANGGKHTIHSSVGTSPPAYNVGDKIPLFYQPTNPDRTLVNDFWHLWGFAAAFGICGGVWLVVGISIHLYAGTRKQPTASS